MTTQGIRSTRLWKMMIFLMLSGVAFAALADDNGLVTKKSKFSAGETLDRLEKVLKKKGIRVFDRISHKKNAEGVKLSLRPTELLIFGNPKLGTHFFTSNQTAGIDLPMKMLAWEDDKGQVWLTYNDPMYITKRHGIKDRDDIAKKMSGALGKFSDIATGAE